jgi:pilus assembly protein FimV
MGRKINAAVLGASFILPGVAAALGLGDITLNSALNQPLSADISIKKVGDLSTAEILTKLAPVKDFERSGVDRAYFLNDIQFDVKFSDDGGASIHLTTLKPVVEPFLNFIVEVQWPQGKLLKEFTLLLDPPAFSQELSQPVVPPMSEISTVQAAASQGRTANAGGFSRPSYPTQKSDVPSGAEVYGPVARNEGLWDIAKKIRPSSSLTIHQTMVALQEKNPGAFLRNNINLLKEGQVLRLPTAKEIARNSYQDALSIVKEQSQRWKAPTRNVAQEAVEPESESQLGGEVEQAPQDVSTGDGRLTLVAGTEGADDNTGVLGASSGGEMNDGAISALQQALTKKEETLDKSVIENENLKAQLEEVNEQLETSAELVQLKDDQIATLQKQLAALEQKAKERAALSPPVTRNESTTGLDNPMVLAGIGAAIVALIVGLMLLRRKTEDDDADELPGQAFTADSLDVEAQDSLSEADGTATRDESELFSPDQSNLRDAPAQDDAVKQELGDVIGEADIYIAYGRFSHAAELLKQGCKAEPDREDIRLKLLEVLAEMGDVDEFSKYDATLRNSSDESVLQAADALYVKVHGVERSSDAEATLDEFNPEESSSEDEFPLETTFDASDNFGDDLDDYSANEETEADSSVFSLHASDAGSESFDEPLDLEDSLSESLEFELPDSESNDDAGFSLDLDAGEDVEQEDVEVAGFEDDTAESHKDQAGNASDGVSLEGLELDDFGDEHIVSEAATLPEEGFDLDLDDLGGLELAESAGGELDGGMELGLDLDDFAGSLEEAGVDLRDTPEVVEGDVPSEDVMPLTESESVDLPDTADLELASAISETMSPDLSGDINLDEDDLDLLADLDENATKLDLARAYLEMGDATGAKEILQEVLADGNDTQKQDAEEMLGQIA